MSVCYSNANVSNFIKINSCFVVTLCCTTWCVLHIVYPYCYHHCALIPQFMHSKTNWSHIQYKETNGNTILITWILSGIFNTYNYPKQVWKTGDDGTNFVFHAKWNWDRMKPSVITKRHKNITFTQPKTEQTQKSTKDHWLVWPEISAETRIFRGN